GVEWPIPKDCTPVEVESSHPHEAPGPASLRRRQAGGFVSPGCAGNVCPAGSSPAPPPAASTPEVGRHRLQHAENGEDQKHEQNDHENIDQVHGITSPSLYPGLTGRVP